MKDFELLPHTADIKLRIYGIDKKSLFKNAVIGMFQAIKPIIKDANIEHDRIISKTLPIKREVTINSEDQEGLLVDFLSEALYLSDVYNEAYLDADIHTLTETSIHATLYGAPIQGFEVVEIKAVTYHDLTFQQTDDGWHVDIVFDI